MVDSELGGDKPITRGPREIKYFITGGVSVILTGMILSGLLKDVSRK